MQLTYDLFFAINGNYFFSCFYVRFLHDDNINAINVNENVCKRKKEKNVRRDDEKYGAQ